MYALVDCNNFYASCERVFNPSLIGKAVVVLSNNDGCVIARSNEAKELGIKMGEPAFQIKELLENKKVAVFSSNYALYGDMSGRVMRILADFVPQSQLEIYSIDEAFLDLSGFEKHNFTIYGKKIAKTVFQGTGIPVSLGIAPTKTLAKLANKFAKKYPKYENVCLIDTDDKRIKALKLTPVNDIWGIGSRQSAKLVERGVKTAYDFTQLSKSWVRKNLTVTGERTWSELQGISCIDMETVPSNKKQICTSRSFGNMTSDFNVVSEAVANFAASCAVKLRKQHSVAVSIMVYIHTNQHRKDLQQYFRNSVITLPVPTNSSSEIIHYALIALQKIYIEGFQYKKAGVIIIEIAGDEGIQTNLFDTKDRKKEKQLMQALDKINEKSGKDSVRVASQGFDRKWKLRQEQLSPNYTTRLDDIINVKLD